MKNLFFCLCFLCSVFTGCSQEARIEFLPDGDQRIVYQRQCVQLKDGESYVMTFKGAEMFDESFNFAFKPYDFFLEKGERLKIKLKNQELEVVNDGSLCAIQNIFLNELNALKRDYYYDWNMKRLTNYKTRWTVNSISDTLKMCFEQFKKQHPNYSKNFERVVELELKYFPILIKYCTEVAGIMFGNGSTEVLKHISNVIEDSKDERSVYSVSYWNAARLYADYLRLFDLEKRLGDPFRYYENELKLVDYFRSERVRERMLFENLEGLMFWATPKDKEQIDKCLVKLTPEHTGKILALWADLEKEQFNNDKANVLNTYPKLSGENVKGEIIDLEQYRGAWILLDVWATWCVPCCAEIPYVSAMEEKFEGKNVVFLSMSVNKEKERETWIEKIQESNMKGLQLRWLRDRDELYELFGMTGIPHFAIIDPEGKLVLNRLPYVSKGVIFRILNNLLERE